MIPASQSRPEPLLSPPIDASSDDFLASVPPPPPPIKREWRTAGKLLRELIADPEQTEKAIEVFYALGRDQFERSFQRLLVHPEGRRLLEQEVHLVDALCDRAALAALPEGSFGRGFLEHRDRTGLDPEGLLEVHARAQWQQVAELDPMRAWFRDRTILTHDLLHVLTGYDTDPVGEATLLAFVLGQGVGRAQALLTFGAGLAAWRVVGWRWPRYLLRAWRRGQRARFLAALPYEELLPLPLDGAGCSAGIEPAEVAHPDGILRGSWAS